MRDRSLRTMRISQNTFQLIFQSIGKSDGYVSKPMRRSLNTSSTISLGIQSNSLRLKLEIIESSIFLFQLSRHISRKNNRKSEWFLSLDKLTRIDDRKRVDELVNFQKQNFLVNGWFSSVFASYDDLYSTPF